MNANDDIAIGLYVLFSIVAILCLYRLIQNSNRSYRVSDNSINQPKETFEDDSVENPLV